MIMLGAIQIEKRLLAQNIIPKLPSPSANSGSNENVGGVNFRDVLSLPENTI